MLIVIVGPSHNSCITRLVSELQSKDLGDVLVFDASHARTSKIELLGNEETAVVYSLEESTPEPLTSAERLKLLRPVVKHLPKPECDRYEQDPRHAPRHHGAQHLLVPSRRTSTWIVSPKNRQFFR